MTTTALKLNLDSTPSTADAELIEAELELLAEKALKSSQKLKAAELQAKSDSEALKKALEKAGKLSEDTKAIGPVRTTIFPTKRFNSELFLASAPKKLQKECSVVAIDSKLVQAKVSPEQYASYQKVSGWTLKVDVAD
jgi:hypothetical protein